VRVLIDTNILLDFLLQREPFFQDAELLFDTINSGLVVGCVAATTLTDIFYIAQKHTRSIEQARQAVAEVLTVMTIFPVDRAVLESAFNSGLTDFEIFCAVTQGLDAILTRDKRGFASSPIPVLAVGELLQQLGSKNSD
jgi:predicted nucleic acid-binding protein